MIAADKVICVTPTDQTKFDVHCGCNFQSDCYNSIGEWIDADSTYGDSVTLVLLGGTHLYNSTNAIRLEKSVKITSQGGEATLVCVHKELRLSSGKMLKISNITFHNCDIFIVNTQHFTIEDMTIGNGKLATNSALSLSRLRRSDYCIGLHILDSKFRNSTLHIEGSKHNFITGGDTFYGTCVDVHIRKVSVENLTWQNKYSAVSIHTVFSVTFFDVAVQNNMLYYTSHILHLFHIGYITFKGHCSFNWNYGKGVEIANISGLTIFDGSEITFLGNEVHGNLLHIQETMFNYDELFLANSSLTFEGNIAYDGSIMVVKEVILEMGGMTLTFNNNTSLKENPWSNSLATIMLLQMSRVFILSSELEFFGNFAYLSGGMTLSNSDCQIRNITANFHFNEGGDGGAMAFYGKSHVLIGDTILNKLQSSLQFCNNQGRNRGGAIFIDDSQYTDVLTKQHENFVQLPSTVYDPKPSNIMVNFNSNTAGLAGDDIYGGWIDTVVATSGVQLNITGHLPKRSSIHAVSSDPVRICFCDISVPVCNITSYQIEIFPGQVFVIAAIAVGQRMGIVPSIVTASFTDEEGHLGESQDVQSVGKQCTKLKFTVFTAKRTRY